jgi:hypothetical protein
VPGGELGFDAIRIADVDLRHAEAGLLAWLQAGYHGDMDYMANHGTKRARPAELVPGTVRAIVARMPYLPMQRDDDWRRHELARLDDPATAVISLYARGRDYHKVLRNRLQQLAARIETAIGAFGYRVFTDSAPVMEVALASQGGLGWRGKHTLLLDRDGGSMFFLGEILVDIPLPADSAEARTVATAAAASTSARPRPSWSPIWWMRGVAFLSDDRTQGRDPEACARRWAIASTVATIANWCARGTSSPIAPRCRTSTCAMASTRPTWQHCSVGAKQNSTSGSKAARSGGSVMNAGCATWP